MRMVVFAFAIVASLALGAPSLGTEPGTPMDCSDLELAPGLTCTEEIFPHERGVGFVQNTVVDNDRRLINSSREVIEEFALCGSTQLQRVTLLRVRMGDAWQSIVIAQDRCVDPAFRHIDLILPGGVQFDATGGSLYVGFVSSCFADIARPNCPYTGPGGPGPGRQDVLWIARIDGFTPLADVLPPPPLAQPLCHNGLDDDGDGSIDSADAHCKSDADNDEARP